MKMNYWAVVTSICLLMGVGCQYRSDSNAATVGSSVPVDSYTANEASQDSTSSTESSNSGRGITLPIQNAEQLKNMLELDDKMVFLTLPGRDDLSNNSFELKSYDIHSGSLLYSINQNNYLEYGNLLRIDKASDIEGYDYRMMFEKAVVYQDSNDITQEKEKIYRLPNVQPIFLGGLRGFGNYDINKAQIVYTTEAGVWLANRDGSNNKLIIESSQLPKMFPGVPDGVFANPRFMDSGTKICIGIFQTLSFEFTGAITYDVQKSQVEYKMDVVLPTNVVYPVEDQYIVGRAWSMGGEFQVLDITNGKIENYTSNREGYPLFASHDYKTLVVAKYDDYPDGMKAFVCKAEEPDDETNPLLFGQENEVLRLSNISEHYVAFSSDNHIVLMKYR